MSNYKRERSIDHNRSRCKERDEKFKYEIKYVSNSRASRSRSRSRNRNIKKNRYSSTNQDRHHSIRPKPIDLTYDGIPFTDLTKTKNKQHIIEISDDSNDDTQDSDIEEIFFDKAAIEGI